MMRIVTFACLGGFVCSAAALAQSSSEPNATAATTGRSAWVYVSSVIGTTNKTDVYGFAAASNGKLTPLAGSPFAADLSSMAVNGVYLFGVPASGTMIDTYRIQSNGTLTYAKSTNAAAANNCGTLPGPVFLDHSGANLYDFYYWGDSICSNNVYQAWKVVKSSGALTYDGAAGGSQDIGGPLTFIGNDKFAYTSDCYHFNPQISGFKRNSDGSLTKLSLAQAWPAARSGQAYCAYLAAADPTNHLAIPVRPYADYGDPAGPYQLASYTVNTTTGAINTGSTYANMPKIAVGDVRAIRMSPSGKLLAVAGTGGLQVLHFNGANPATAYTGLMSTNAMDAVYWDNNDHLYAIGTAANKLVVFTVTPVSWKWVATYTVHQPVGLIVQPLPLPWR